jgi:chromosome segregation ATPase
MDQSVIYATEEFYKTQISAFQEVIEKKDALIVRLQDEVSQKNQAISNHRTEENNLRNSIKEYLVEALESDEITESVAESIANLCGFELSKEVEVEVTVTYNLTLQVPYNEDVESIVNDIDFESVSYNSDNVTWLSSSVDRIDF